MDTEYKQRVSDARNILVNRGAKLVCSMESKDAMAQADVYVTRGGSLVTLIAYRPGANKDPAWEVLTSMGSSDSSIETLSIVARFLLEEERNGPRATRQISAFGPADDVVSPSAQALRDRLERELAAREQFFKLFSSKDEALEFELYQGWVADGQTGLEYWSALIDHRRARS